MNRPAFDALIGSIEAVAGHRFTQALRHHPLSDDIVLRLATPEEVRRVVVPVRRDSGALEMLTAWRVCHSRALGPSKGGVRFAADVSESQLLALAFRIMLKCAVNGLPHGGAGGGVVVAPHTLSRTEREQVARRYVDALGAAVAVDRDILSPDLGTDAETMAWMADQHTKAIGDYPAGAINGKPVALGGIPGRPGATARGAWIVLDQVLRAVEVRPKGLTFAIQGYGSAGGHLAVLLERQGLRLVAAADGSGALSNPAGLNAAALWAHKQAGGRFSDLQMAAARHGAAVDVLTADADILIPAATDNQITAGLASRLSARFVLEIANGPVASDAEPVLASRGITVIPDLVANAGGITMSHFEWRQNREGARWTEADARERLDARMADTSRALIDAATRHAVPLAVAAQLLAIDRLERVLQSSLATLN